MFDCRLQKDALAVPSRLMSPAAARNMLPGLRMHGRGGMHAGRALRRFCTISRRDFASMCLFLREMWRF
jgi:hypothetical protein